VTDPSKIEWRAVRVTFHELEKNLNDLAQGGWELLYMFAPVTKDQGFTLVCKRPAQNPAGGSRSMGFSE
jgi:hypothetical protein